VHGDEYEGPEAIRLVVAAFQHGQFPGKLIALPVANPMAYAAGTRLTPCDGGNLNRAFPGSPTGTATERWAGWLWRTFMVRADRLIDLHSGGVTWQFEPVAGFYRDEDLPLAASLGLTLWQMPDTPGVLSREFRHIRGPAVGAELGFGGVRDEALVANTTQAVVTLLCGEGRQSAGPVYRHTDVVTDWAGEWIATRHVSDDVAEGEVLGQVNDWTGNRVQEIRTPVSGRLLALRRLVSMQSGDLVAVVGTPREGA
jgi:N-alpha-acetyl-L-2,4-diaminobutyrate deacetylase